MSKKQMKNKMKKYIILIVIVVFVVFSVCLYIIFNNKITLKEYENDSYYLKYNSGWILKRNTSEEVNLTNNKKAIIDIKVSSIDEENKYLTIDEMIDNISYDMGIQNTNYKLLSKDTFSTKDGDNGYKFLYENDENQVLVALYKKNDKLVVFTYEALNEYYDILLDNALDTLYEFKIKNEVYDLKSELSISNEEIKLDSNSIDSNLSGSKEYDIANNNYYVKYTLPDNFKLTNMDSTFDSFSLNTGSKENITLSVNLFNSNVYDFIDSLKKRNTYVKENDGYTDYKEIVTKYDNEKYKSYIYKVNYTDKSFSLKIEKVSLLYIIDKSHTLSLEFVSTDNSISKNIIDSFKISDVKGYSRYITSVRENNMLVGTLMRKNNDVTESVTIKLPSNYEEYQLFDQNVYQTKNYGLLYNENTELYNYIVSYELMGSYSNENSIISAINSSLSTSYGKYKKLVKGKNININNKNFIVYDGGESKIGGTMFTAIDRFNYYVNIKVLLYKLDTGGYLVIKISGNGKNITNELLTETTNFDIKNM